ncbi:MAG: sigma-70 family RNA polymerase sigma factor [Candidatus Krumholzibacteria bacterium]|nr:sigma-70 family RNA polymerase sigma factor [Candidatus Krumholzibacteria bacterium]
MQDEQALVRAMQGGDTAAFRRMVERFQHDVYYLALDLTGDHHDAEDLSQEVFVKAHRGIRNFWGGAKLSTWLYRITMNAYLDSKRRKAPVVVSLVASDGGGGDDLIDLVADETASGPEEAAAAARIDAHVRRALGALSDQERTVFVMRHYQDMPIKDIADGLDVAEGTVKSLLFRGVRKLRGELSFYREELGLEDTA